MKDTRSGVGSVELELECLVGDAPCNDQRNIIAIQDINNLHGTPALKLPYPRAVLTPDSRLSILNPRILRNLWIRL